MYARINTCFNGSIINAKPPVSLNPQIGLTLHKQDENNYIAIAINYSDEIQNYDFQVDSEWKFETIIGNINTTNKCDVTVLRLSRNI